MFGDAYSTVAANAANAYKNVQMSQNEYLTQVNGFATGLKTALGGNAQAAAELANRIITAEADVVAATGASQESVQNAFNGIMKSNYTMLDNLQLGITPTKEGFQSLIDSVNVWNAENGKMTEYTIDNLADCQSALVDYIDMQGLAGYAANEAADTIQGSVASMKSAWQDLLTGFADENANLEVLMGNLVDSAMNVYKNIEPRIMQITQGIANFAALVVPAIVNTIGANAPMLLESAATIITTLVGALASNLPALGAAALDMVKMLLTTISGMLPEILEAGVELIVTLIDGLASNPGQLIATTAEIIATIVSTLIAAIPRLLDSGFELLLALIDGLIKSIPQLLAAAGDIVGSLLKVLFEAVMDFFGVGKDVVQKIEDGIASAWQGLCDWFKGIWDSLFGGLNVNVGVTGTGGGGSAGGGGGRGGNPGSTRRGTAGVGKFATGLERVPYDNFPAYLHKGEMVVPAGQADYLRAGAFSQRSEEQTTRIIAVLTQILDAVNAVDASGMTITLDRREFGRAVRAVT
nr:MAG TPA: tail tape measure protein [Caudoviricetes sp.]